MYLFSCIPEAPLVSILMDWLSWRDCGRLDSALCNRESRSNFHQFAESSGHACSKLWSDCEGPNVQWLIKRGIRCSVIHIGRNLLCDTILQEKLFIHTGHVVKSIEINLASVSLGKVVQERIISNVLEAITSHCPCLQELKLSLGWTKSRLSDVDVEALQTFINVHPSLSSLTINSAHNLPALLIQYAVNKLNKLSLKSCTVQEAVPISSQQCAARRIATFECSESALPSSLCAVVTDLTIFFLNNDNNSEPSTKIANYKNLRQATVHAQVDIHIAQLICTHWSNLMFLRITTLRGYKDEEITVMLIKQLPLLRVLDTSDGSCDFYERSCRAEPSTSGGGSPLHTLSMYCGWVGTLMEILPLCPQLTTLSMVLKDRPGPVVPVEKSLHLLKSTKVDALYLNGYYNLSNEDVIALQHMPLHTLSITNVGGGLNNQAIFDLVPTLHFLHTLDLSYCAGLTYQLVMQVPPLCPTLRSYTFRRPLNWCTNGCGKSSSHFILNDILPRIFPHVREFMIRC